MLAYFIDRHAVVAGSRAPTGVSSRFVRSWLIAEGPFRLASKFVTLVAIAGREMEGDKSANARSLCDDAGLTCRKVPPLRGKARVRFAKGRFDEELVGTTRQRDDPFDIAVVIS